MDDLLNEEHEYYDDQENHEELPEEKPLWKKILLLGITIFLILLMISFIFVSYPIGPLLEGKIESDLIKNNQLDLGDFIINFEEGSYAQLSSLYHPDQKTEFSACLIGEKKGRDYYIQSLYQPKMYKQTYNHVSFEACNQETIIMLHTHPYKQCVASDTDINTLKSMQKSNPKVLMVVMCEPDRFSVYS